MCTCTKYIYIENVIINTQYAHTTLNTLPSFAQIILLSLNRVNNQLVIEALSN